MSQTLRVEVVIQVDDILATLVYLDNPTRPATTTRNRMIRHYLTHPEDRDRLFERLAPSLGWCLHTATKLGGRQELLGLVS